jgi:hypothetical protein
VRRTPIGLLLACVFCAYAKTMGTAPLRIRKESMNSRIRITAVRRRFDPEAFAAVLVAAALARLDEEGAEAESGHQSAELEDGDD